LEETLKNEKPKPKTWTELAKDQDGKLVLTKVTDTGIAKPSRKGKRKKTPEKVKTEENCLEEKARENIVLQERNV
jgi:hypothetical protein